MMWKRFCSMLDGRRVWIRIKKRYDVEHGVYVLLMPEDDQVLNEQALRHIEDLIGYRSARGVVILTKFAWIKEYAAAYTTHILGVVECTSKTIDNLLIFYEFYRFSERLLVVSLTKPYGNKAWKAIGIRGISKEDMVCLAILGIRNWSKEG